MKTRTRWPWRLCFVLAAIGILLGGMQHPRGDMAAMLADPAWYHSHVLVLVGFLGVWAGLHLMSRGGTLPVRTDTWRRLAIGGTALQCVEMVVHTVAAVDLENLLAGQSTPVLSTHLHMANVMYPLFGATMVGFIVVAARDRALGMPYTAWLGVAGAAAHGLAPPLVQLANIPQARVLFPMVMLFALWLLLAAVRGLRTEVFERGPTTGVPARGSQTMVP